MTECKPNIASDAATDRDLRLRLAVPTDRSVWSHHSVFAKFSRREMGICWPAPLSRFQTYVHMCRFAVFAFSVFALAFFPCDGNELKKQWLAHLRRVSATGFPCGEPQNRTVDVRELVDDDAWQEMKFFEVSAWKICATFRYSLNCACF